MNSRKFRIQCVLLSTIIIVFLASTARADTLTDQVDKLFKTWDKPDSPGCALGVIKDGRFIYTRGYGMANLEYNIPLTSQSVFRIGSTSKQFTAMCIALLEEQGKIAVDDSLQTDGQRNRLGLFDTVAHFLNRRRGPYGLPQTAARNCKYKLASRMAPTPRSLPSTTRTLCPSGNN
ncbi:MAG: serine hydrolase [Candidatus Aminicenantes bacterium]|nr:MAG: serine hydrolase [Candidatus Aminicenantes bacterium]